jgi:uncharacterized membrane protein
MSSAKASENFAGGIFFGMMGLRTKNPFALILISSMNKARLEALSDGIFAIVMTLLALEIRIPKLHEAVSSDELLRELAKMEPLFVSYFVSFAVLAMFWISHHAFYHLVVRTVNRPLALLNTAYLALIAFVTFSAHLLGTYSSTHLAAALYGGNLLLISLMDIMILRYALASKEVDTRKATSRAVRRAKARMAMTTGSVLLGVAVSFLSLPIALALYAFPIAFNFIPGGLDLVGRRVGALLRIG